MYYSIDIYMYDKTFQIVLEKKIFNVLSQKQLKDTIVQRSIQGGHHLSLIFSNELSRRYLHHYIKEQMINYKPIKIDKDKLISQIKIVSKIEEVKADLNIKEDGYVELNEYNEIISRKINNIYSKDSVEKLEIFKSQLFFDILDMGYYNMQEDRQNILLVNLFLNASNLHKAGLKFGYLSMKSNILYFVSQLETIKSAIGEVKYNQIYSYLYDLSPIEKDFYESGIKDFLYQNSGSILYSRTKELVTLLNEFYVNGMLIQSNLKQADAFFDNSKNISHLSEFHKTFFSNEKFIEQYKSKEFIIYRYVVDVFYQMMPLLKVSPIRKQKITKLLSDAVEAYYDTNWQEIYNEINKRVD